MTKPDTGGRGEGRMDSPIRIFATVNGMSTRLPDGGRQFIGGWSQDRERPHAVEYIRADVVEGIRSGLSAMLEEFSNAAHHNCGCVSCKVMQSARAALQAQGDER